MKIINENIGIGGVRSPRTALDIKKSLAVARAKEGLTPKNLRARKVFKKPCEVRNEKKKNRLKAIRLRVNSKKESR